MEKGVVIPRKIEASTTREDLFLQKGYMLWYLAKSRLLHPPEYQQVAYKQPATQIITDCQSAR